MQHYNEDFVRLPPEGISVRREYTAKFNTF